MAETKTTTRKTVSKKVKGGTEPAKQHAVRLVDRLGETFSDMEQRIRERAYNIFLDRGASDGDSMADWLKAQMEMLNPVALEVKEQKRNIVVEADLKGYDLKDIEVQVAGDHLKVFGSHTESDTRSSKGTQQTATETRHFYQAVTLPDTVDSGDVHAKLLKNGKLKITLTRVPAA